MISDYPFITTPSPFIDILKPISYPRVILINPFTSPKNQKESLLRKLSIFLIKFGLYDCRAIDIYTNLKIMKFRKHFPTFLHFDQNSVLLTSIALLFNFLQLRILRVSPFLFGRYKYLKIHISWLKNIIFLHHVIEANLWYEMSSGKFARPLQQTKIHSNTG